MSGYSTLRSGPGPATRDQENLDYETLSRSGIVSEEELEKWVTTGSCGVVMLHTYVQGDGCGAEGGQEQVHRDRLRPGAEQIQVSSYSWG